MAAAAAKAAQPRSAQDQARRRRRRSRRASPRCARRRPKATLIVDANEGWNDGNLAANLAACAAAGVVLVEQPLPDGRDEALAGIAAADPGLRRRKRARPRLARGARRPIRRGQHQARQDRRPDRGAGHGGGGRTHCGFAIMVGCMVATSLPWRRRCCWRRRARFVDLDGPLLLARDRPDGLRLRRQPGLSAAPGAVGLNTGT